MLRFSMINKSDQKDKPHAHIIIASTHFNPDNNSHKSHIKARLKYQRDSRSPFNEVKQSRSKIITLPFS